jgi:hypothetical protein
MTNRTSIRASFIKLKSSTNFHPGSKRKHKLLIVHQFVTPSSQHMTRCTKIYPFLADAYFALSNHANPLQKTPLYAEHEHNLVQSLVK